MPSPNSGDKLPTAYQRNLSIHRRLPLFSVGYTSLLVPLQTMFYSSMYKHTSLLAHDLSGR